MEKKFSNYKTNFVYSIMKTGEAVNITIDFNIEGEKPSLSVFSSKTLEQSDIKNILTAMEKNLLYRMDFDLKSGCSLHIDNSGELSSFESLENLRI